MADPGFLDRYPDSARGAWQVEPCSTLSAMTTLGLWLGPTVAVILVAVANRWLGWWTG
jgi:hypothetical protein